MVEGTRSRGGQGFGLTTLERRAVEEHAMKLAENHLTSKGYFCEITSAYKPFDILASNSTEKFIVEVKGTTSTGAHIIMTANEVKVHREQSPNNALYVVHSIQLIRESAGFSPAAKGGVLVISKPWNIDQHEMKALAYQVKL
ncbi:DUF3883 domain-containing protein [Phyllobacterium sp. 628]|uniref:protein NO VEIN domain-containing protein n=1 Tax=Phyllobacterium sp. 628 TaxID=2718938 RepID=UPI0016624011|nr:DUF3883 domain-containing protein [Phyllobacterium sp. 628]QND51828.1 DUF3883 domain-containing protein [Phyllobacterium sp. 628]